MQHRGPGAKTTEVEAHVALVCASTDNSKLLTGGTNLIWTMVIHHDDRTSRFLWFVSDTMLWSQPTFDPRRTALQNISLWNNGYMVFRNNG